MHFDMLSRCQRRNVRRSLSRLCASLDGIAAYGLLLPSLVSRDTAWKDPFTQGGIGMPGGDRTGPGGLGPITGRGLGSCARARPGGSFGGYYGRAGGFGRARGWRHRYQASGFPGWGRAGRCGFRAMGYSSWTPQDELDDLKDYTLGLEEAFALPGPEWLSSKRPKRAINRLRITVQEPVLPTPGPMCLQKPHDDRRDKSCPEPLERYKNENSHISNGTGFKRRDQSSFWKK
jgi:hypothetical protein